METSTLPRILRRGQHLRSGAWTITEIQIRILKIMFRTFKIFCSWPKRHFESWNPVEISVPTFRFYMFEVERVWRVQGADWSHGTYRSQKASLYLIDVSLQCQLQLRRQEHASVILKCLTFLNFQLQKRFFKGWTYFLLLVHFCWQTKRYSTRRSSSSGGAAC